MCDEYYDAKTKAFWRSLADEAELEDERDEPNEAVVLPTIEPPKAKPKPMLR